MIKKLRNPAILLSKVADDKLRDILGLQNGSPKNQKENEVLLEALSSSFNSEFVDNGALRELSTAIIAQSSDLNSKNYPYIPLFQSSGYGKSKLIYELAQKEFFTIYWCLRKGNSGFPIQASAIVDNLNSLVRDSLDSFYLLLFSSHLCLSFSPHLFSSLLLYYLLMSMEKNKNPKKRRGRE